MKCKRSYRKLASLFLTIAMLIGIISAMPLAAGAVFAPVQGPLVGIIDQRVPLSDFGGFAPFVTGYEDGTFRGNNNTSREEFVFILYNLLNEAEDLPVADADNPSFGDVAPDSWTYDAIEWAYAQEIIVADDEGNFNPADFLTRVDMVVMLVNALSWTEPAENTLTDIDDNPYYDEILIAINAGIVTGYEDGTFRPDDYVIRYEVVTAVVRYWLHGEPADVTWEDIEVPLTDVSRDDWAYKYVALAITGFSAPDDAEDTESVEEPEDPEDPEEPAEDVDSEEPTTTP